MYSIVWVDAPMTKKFTLQDSKSAKQIKAEAKKVRCNPYTVMMIPCKYDLYSLPVVALIVISLWQALSKGSDRLQLASRIDETEAAKNMQIAQL